MQNTEFLSFLIRTVTVGTGISPVRQTLADFTADVEFHQPPKSGQRPQETVFILSILTRSVFKPRENQERTPRRPFSIIFSIIPNYARISETTPEPTVLPPSRIAKRRPFSIAIAEMSSTVISTLSPGRHISTPSGRLITPVTSVVLK